MSNLKKQLYDRETNQNISPITDTEAVFDSFGSTAEQRLVDLEHKMSGRGDNASASSYPILMLGRFSTMEAANAKLDEIYSSTLAKYQGRLRLEVNGTLMWVEQHSINAQQNYWMQIVYGPYTKNTNGTALIQDLGKAHITYRVTNGVTDVPWSDYQISGLNLATINGQSVTNGGNIVVTEQGVLPIDDAFDTSSENAIQNAVVAQAIASLQESVTGLEKDKFIKVNFVIKYNVTVQEGTYTGDDGGIALDVFNNRVLLFITTTGGTVLFYSSWVATDEYKASSEIDIYKDYFIYTDTGGQDPFIIYHWSTEKDEMATSVPEKYSVSPIIEAEYWCSFAELPSNKSNITFWYDTETNILKKRIDFTTSFTSFATYEGIHLVLNPHDGKIYEVDNHHPGTLPRLLDSDDLQDINDRINDLDAEGKGIFYINYWGSDTTSQYYRNLQVGDYWYNPSDHLVKRKTGDNTFETVEAKVALLFNTENASYYSYEEGENAVYDKILDTKDLQMGGTIVNKIDEKIAANETKYLGNIYEVKWWQSDTPENPQIGEYWFDSDFHDLHIITNVDPVRTSKVNTSSKGSLLMRRLDDSTYHGKVYEVDYRTEEIRLLDSSDLTNIQNDVAEKLDEADLNSILTSPNGETTLRVAADNALSGRIDTLSQSIVMVNPLGALVQPSEINPNTLSSFRSEYVYDLVFATNTDELLLRERHIETYDEYGEPATFDSTTYYREWTASGKPAYVEHDKASDTVFKPSSSYIEVDSDFIPSPLKGFYYFLDGEDLTIYKWNVSEGTLAKTGTGEGGGSGDINVDYDSENNTITIGDVVIPIKTVNSQTLLTSGNISIENGITLPDNSKNVIYPEAFGAYGDGVNFYDWPLVCFGGIIDTAVTIEQADSTIYVPAPSERLFGDIKNISVNTSTGELVYSSNNYGLSVTAADVKYSTVHHRFLLHYNNKYYKIWKNSGIWNYLKKDEESDDNVYPRTDAVYSDISIDTVWENAVTADPPSYRYNYQSLETKLVALHRKAKRVSYIFKKELGEDAYGVSYDANSFVNIERFMHNDYEAFYNWLSKAENGYSLKLTKGKIYYIEIPYATYNSSSWSNTLLYTFGGGYWSHNIVDYYGAEIDFGGAVLFVRLNDSWFPHISYYNGAAFSSDSKDTQGQSSIFQIGGCRNITFKNLTVRALRDRDGGCVGKNARLSSSDSALVLFDFVSINDSSVVRDNIKILNLDVTNMTRDFNAEPNNNSLKNLEIDGWKSVGVGWNGIRGGSFIIKNADVTTAKYLGGCGYHIFYLKGQENFVCIDSTFRHPDHFNEPMLSYGNSYNVSISPVTFINCTIDVDYIGEGTNLRFVECKLIQKYFYFVSGGKEFRSLASDTSGGFITLNGNGIELYNSIVYLTCHYLGYNGNNDLVLDNVTVFTADTLTKPIFRNYQGIAKVKNFKTNYTGTIGISTTDYDAYQRSLIEADIQDLEQSVGFALQPSFGTTAPTGVPVGTYWYDTNQTSNVDNGLKIYNGSTWEAVDTGKARILYDSAANSGAGALYLCLNGKKYKTFTLS